MKVKMNKKRDYQTIRDRSDLPSLKKNKLTEKCKYCEFYIYKNFNHKNNYICHSEKDCGFNKLRGFKRLTDLYMNVNPNQIENIFRKLKDIFVDKNPLELNRDCNVPRNIFIKIFNYLPLVAQANLVLRTPSLLPWIFKQDNKKNRLLGEFLTKIHQIKIGKSCLWCGTYHRKITSLMKNLAYAAVGNKMENGKDLICCNIKCARDYLKEVKESNDDLYQAPPCGINLPHDPIMKYRDFYIYENGGLLVHKLERGEYLIRTNSKYKTLVYGYIVGNKISKNCAYLIKKK